VRFETNLSRNYLRQAPNYKVKPKNGGQKLPLITVK